MFNIRRGLGRSVMLAAAVLALPACDVSDPLEGVDLVLDVEDAPVEINATVAVVPGQVSTTNTTVSTPSDIKSVQDITNIEVQPSYFTFTSTGGSLRTASANGPDASGLIVVVMRIGHIPFAMSLIVTNNVVTSVAPARLLDLSDLAAWKQRVVDAVNTLPAAQRPDLSAFQNMTVEQVKSALTSSLGGSSFPLTINVYTSNTELTGTLRLGQFDLGGRFTF